MSPAPKKSTRKSLKARLGLLGRAALVGSTATALTVALGGSAHAGVPTPLAESTTSFQKTFQPVFDYDSDSCFPAAAIDGNGNLNGGLDDSGPVTGQCRSGHLGQANTYSRVKCNNGWCAIVYTLYFEKDMSCADCTATSHRHDWEAAVLWVRQGASTPEYASVSAHGGYSTTSFGSVPRDGVRLRVVYHKDGALTHAFRFAKSGETAEAWGNGGWDFPALVSWNSFPGGDNKWTANLQSRLQNATWGDANFPLKDGRFTTELSRAMPSGISFDPNGAG
ncbi:NPP1 family protein [Streptomyces europaeiscabiei]|uniref:NPP1 family protein n=1 Tax=Streptomyces europaeiscabiei TaxID=146819 RepID=UPI0029A5E6B0|nr:NPP1 family protein [Streptomyces europaeiscabiei]MDX3780345.1 NPP1 family protein [Streptomyces europaeiscabiei]